MALSEVLKIIHNIRDDVKVVDDKGHPVIGDKLEVAVVGDNVHCVDGKVKSPLTVREACPLSR